MSANDCWTLPRIAFEAVTEGNGGAGALGHGMSAGLGIVLLKLAFALIIVLIVTHQIKSVLHALQPAQQAGATANTSRNGLPMPARSPDAGVLPSMQAPRGTGPALIDHFTGTTVEEGRAGMPSYHPPTAAEQCEANRKADEAIRILEASTPEM